MVDAPMPSRVQLRRAKGWKMPPNTVKVDRSTKLGNPFVIGVSGDAASCVSWHAAVLSGGIVIDLKTPEAVQRQYRADVLAAREEMRGKNLACWCRLDRPCHADNLLIFFNRQKDG